MATRANNPVDQFFDDAGNPLIDGKIYYFATGTNTFQDTFADENLEILNTNPVILTAAGRSPNVWLQDRNYKEVLTDSDDVQIWERDPVGGESDEGAFSIWGSTITYSINEIVEGSDGNFYKSITNSNTGNDPTSSAANWEQIEFIGVWNTNITYSIGDTVRGSDGNLYRALTATSGNDPISDRVNWAQAINLDYINGTSLEATNVRQAADASLGTGTHTFDFALADMGQLTATGDITVEFSNFVSGEVSSYITDAVNWGAHTITLPAGILFAGGTAPAFTAAGTDRFLFLNDKDDVLTLHVVGQALAV